MGSGPHRLPAGIPVGIPTGIFTCGPGPLRHWVPTDPGLDSPLRADLQVTCR